MKSEDFVFDRMFTYYTNEGVYEEFWFEVKGETQDELTYKYMERGMITVSHIVYARNEDCARNEDIVGIYKRFLFGAHVVYVNWDELKNMVKSIVQEMKG